MTSLWGKIAAWYRADGRDLPWRRTEDPYRIVVSECMLQQTQVDRVVPLFLNFTRLFPSWEALSAAPQSDVVRAWKGLGYNMRALRLKAMAEAVVARHGGSLPSDLESLLALKGVGPYTARAIRAFAFREQTLAPDTNLRRVLNRVFKGPLADPKRFDTRAWARWEESVPKNRAYDVNQGLMDIGATICKAQRPACEACPLRASCKAYPRILKIRKLPSQKTARKERVDALGIPNRIYRGRVIDFLRARSLPTAALDRLGRSVRERYDDDAHRDWLIGVLAGLEKDGLVIKKRGRWVLA